MNSDLQSLVLFILIMSLASCSQKQSEEQYASLIKEPPEQKEQVLDNTKEHHQWIEYINDRSDKVKHLYTELAYKVYEDGQFIQGRNQIANDHFNAGKGVLSITTDTLIIANEQRGLIYELCSLEDEDKSKYKNIIIWEVTDATRQRVFEFSALEDAANEDLSDLNKRRAQWMEICNSHDPSKLVKEVYSDNTIYFNHKPLVIGHEALIKEYSYMSRENYKLTLTPIVLDQINQDIVFEIGQCSGSYQGKYILIWKKSDLGIWEVFIDSNI